MIHLLYLLILLPWITDFLEGGRFPINVQEVLSELSLSILVAIGVYAFIQQRAEDLMRAADRVLAKAKTRGGRISFMMPDCLSFSGSMICEALSRSD